jgi:hypothetical protein
MIRASHLLLAALPLLAAACAPAYRTQVVRSPGAPGALAPLPQAEVVRTKPPTAGAEVAKIEAVGNTGSNAADCDAFLAGEAAKMGAPVVVVDNETPVAGAPHCAGTAYAPGQ